MRFDFVVTLLVAACLTVIVVGAPIELQWDTESTSVDVNENGAVQLYYIDATSGLATHPSVSSQFTVDVDLLNDANVWLTPLSSAE